MGGPLDEMRRYFIGGSPELNDPFYAVKPHLEVTKSGSKITHLNRFGFRTLSTGTVRLRLNLLFQSQALVDGSKNVRSKSGTPYSRFVPQGLKDKHGGMFHLVSIVQSFQQARARMVQAREQVLKDLKTE
jgi:Meckel syndrome type 1 protein